jgi:hypothetical protein
MSIDRLGKSCGLFFFSTASRGFVFVGSQA